ncbi:MAG: DUF1702 family protein [Dehalococcoidia bacterium]
MATAGPLPMADKDQPAPARLLRLPLGLADFSRRGFRIDRPADRRILETHARSFLTGFNLAAQHWRDPHPALQTIPAPERGFAYEGAGMYAGIRAILARGDGAAFRRLCSGVGDDYIHLIHVGYGWAGAALPNPTRTVPSTPLLRWLALDGTGFARVYFGGSRMVRSLWSRPPRDHTSAMMAGAGRALWFVESASPDDVAAIIEQAPGHARSELWAGIGLASCYAGCADAGVLDAMVHASGADSPAFGQGALFAIAARARSGTVPRHTEQACQNLFGIDPDQARDWTDVAANGLTELASVGAYAEWKSRLRRTIAARL